MNPVSNAVRKILERQSKNIVAAAEEMPADKFSYKPTPTQMTFAALVEHTTGTNNFLCAQISGTSSPPEEKLSENDPKEKLVSALKASFDYCTQALAKVDDSKLGESIPFFGGRQVSRAAGNDHSRHCFCRPLRHGGDVFAVEWTGAADREAKGIVTAVSLSAA